MLSKASKACREACADAKIIIHTERVADTTYVVDFYKAMDDAGVDYDIIGTSYYSYYHGSLEQLEAVLNAIGNNFQKDIMVVETGYYHDWQPDDVSYDLSSEYPISEEGQQAFTEALIDLLNAHAQVTGLLWWNMDANEYGLDWTTNRVIDNWYNASLFDNSTGKAMGAITVLKNFLDGGVGSTGIKTTASDISSPSGKKYTLGGVQAGDGNGQLPAGIYITQGKKIMVK